MPPPIVTREFREEDYDAVIPLWQQSDGVEIAEGDDRASIVVYLKRNPSLSRVAVSDGQVIAAVLCGHDGRRGLIYHLAIAPGLRGRGVGRTLVAECIGGLRSCGIKRALILIAKDNEVGQDFWRAQGFEEISGAIPFGLDVI